MLGGERQGLDHAIQDRRGRESIDDDGVDRRVSQQVASGKSARGFDSSVNRLAVESILQGLQRTGRPNLIESLKVSPVRGATSEQQILSSDELLRRKLRERNKVVA